MTRPHGSRLLLLLLGALALGCALLASTAVKAHAQSAVDQYLEQNPDGKGGGSKSGSGNNPRGGSSGGGKSDGSGSGSAGGSGSGSDASGGSGSGSDDKEKRKKDRNKTDDSGTVAPSADGGDGPSSGSANPVAAQKTSADTGDGGGSGALWIVLLLLVVGPALVFVWWRFGRGRGGEHGSHSEPQRT
jgi:uncharacterized protein HemX